MPRPRSPVIGRAFAPASKESASQRFKTPSSGAMKASFFPSGETFGEAYSGLPKKASRGMSPAFGFFAVVMAGFYQN